MSEHEKITVTVGGTTFSLDYTDADADLLEEIMRHVKGILKKLEERARQRAQQQPLKTQ